jgi:hypothetical protein
VALNATTFLFFGWLLIRGYTPMDALAITGSVLVIVIVMTTMRLSGLLMLVARLAAGSATSALG